MGGVAHEILWLLKLKMAEHRMELCMHGYHICKDIWLAENDQILSCQREIRNRKDPYAVPVTKDGATIGHLP